MADLQGEGASEKEVADGPRRLVAEGAPGVVLEAALREVVGTRQSRVDLGSLATRRTYFGGANDFQISFQALQVKEPLKVER